MFYCGETSDLDKRLELHNSGFFKGSFTAKDCHWMLKLKIPCSSRAMARAIEAHIKRNGTKKFKNRRINEPDLGKYTSISAVFCQCITETKQKLARL